MSDKIRILHIVPSLSVDRGGPSRSIVGLAMSQAHAGALVSVLAGGEIEVFKEYVKDKVKYFEGRHLSLPYEVPGLKLINTMKIQILAADIIHLHSIWNGTISIAACMCRYYKKPYILCPRGMLDNYNLKHKYLLKKIYFNILERRNMKGAAGWHFLDITELNGCKWLSEYFPLEPHIIEPNGLDLQKVDNEIKPIKFPTNKTNNLNLVFIGRIHRIKGIEFQLKILKYLEGLKMDLDLYIVGPDDGDKKRLSNIINKMNINSRVHFLGPIYNSERFSWMKYSNAVLLTSHYECNSNVAIETLAVGGLLMATDTCHLDLAKKKGAAIVLPRSAELFANTIIDLTNNPEKANKIRNMARSYASEHLDWNNIAKKILGYYKNIIK